MRVVIIQISDVHFRGTRDNISARAKAVFQAVLAEVPEAEFAFLVLTGDIANTGDASEYEIAKGFVGVIKSGLLSGGIGDCDVIAIPGNHDLDLRVEDDTRRFVLDALKKYLENPVDFSSSTYKSIISVQDNFFRFLSEISGKSPIPNSERLYYRSVLNVHDRRILFHCFNTAWLSRQNEQQAKLFLPPQIYKVATPPDVDLSFALLHHPYNWLDANNAKQLKEFVETQADIVLSGHEHDADIVRSDAITGPQLDNMMAPAFNDQNVAENGFQILTIDFDKETQGATIFNWENTHFAVLKTQEWTLRRNAERVNDPLALRPEFVAELRDMGTAFRHPRCNEPHCDLRLRDMFVYPDLKHREIDTILKKVQSEKPSILGKAFAEFLSSHPRVLVFGADDCGKTSLAKITFEDLRNRGDFPLLLRGEVLKRAIDDKKLVAILSKAICEQYATKSATPYFQLDQKRRVLIIDDFDKTKLSREGQQKLVECIGHRFERMLVFAPDYLEIRDMMASAETDPFLGFERCTIKEFGYYHRQKLIETWIKFGRDASEENKESIHKLVQKIDKTISTLMGKNTLPHHPVTILSLLQLLESKDTVSTANGAYGYLYEMLLKQALAKVNPRDVDEKITYLSGIGYAMFRNKQPSLTEEEMRREHDSYCEKYDMVRDFSVMMENLVKAEVLVESAGTYHFKYPYEFYYATAKYFQDHAASLRKELYTISDYIYGERNANVLIFYVYLTKDDDLIRHIVNNAKRIFSDFSECDLEDDVEFMNRLATTTPPPLELEYGSASDRRDEYNKNRDRACEQGLSPLEVDDDDVAYDDALQSLTKVLIAIKTLQVLGQILRNFTSSLEGPIKLEITRECYSLGLRTIMAILSFCHQDVPGVRQYIGSLVAERTGITDPKKLAARTEDVIVWMGTSATHGMVKRVSFAVGHSDLTKTYRKVLDGDGRLSIQVIDAAIRLDHFENPPEKELKQLAVKVRKNNFTYSVLRQLVADYIYFYDHDFSTMQRVGSHWNIAVNAPKYLAARAKK